MDIINIDKLIQVLKGYQEDGNTAITLEHLTNFFEEYKDKALTGDSSWGFITKPGKQYSDK